MCRVNVVGVVALLSLLLAPTATDACSLSRSYSSDNSLEASGVVDFNVAPDAVTTCKITCDSGSFTTLYLKYGGSASITSNDGSDFDLGGCDIDLDIVSTDEEYKLGWSLQVTTPFSNLELSCSCTEPGDGGTGGTTTTWGCFSELATVETLNMGTIPMRDLELGDRVLTGRGQYQTVYSFGHYHETQEQEFLQIYTESDPQIPLELTADHLISIRKNSNKQEQTVRADALQVGDRLVHATRKSRSQSDTITRISTIQRRGVYAPLTPDGTISVNGWKVSNYVSLSGDAPGVVANRVLFGMVAEDSIYHWWMSAYRLLCMGVSSNYCVHNHNEEGVLNWLVLGRDWVRFAETQNFFVQILGMGLPLFLVFGLLNLLELAVGPGLAPSLVGLLLAGYVWRRRRSGRATIPKKQLWRGVK